MNYIIKLFTIIAFFISLSMLFESYNIIPLVIVKTVTLVGLSCLGMFVGRKWFKGEI